MTAYEEVPFVGGAAHGKNLRVQLQKDGTPPPFFSYSRPGPINPPRLDLYVDPVRDVYELVRIGWQGVERWEYRHVGA